MKGPRIQEGPIPAAQWKQVDETRHCPNCQSSLVVSISAAQATYKCRQCLLIIWHNYDYTDLGRAVTNGYGWAGAPFADGTYPELTTNHTYGCYYKQPIDPSVPKSDEVPF